jgi:hypothetical protein
MTLNWDGGWLSYFPKCSAPSEALCRAKWDCDCESWSRVGVDEQGPWHEVYDGWDLEAGRHYGKPGGDCGWILFIEDCPDELGKGEVTFPITMEWNGDGYVWSPSE